MFFKYVSVFLVLFAIKLLRLNFTLFVKVKIERAFPRGNESVFCELSCAKNNNIDTLMVETKILPA